MPWAMSLSWYFAGLVAEVLTLFPSHLENLYRRCERGYFVKLGIELGGV
jgi:hypothetical protein